MDNNYSSMALTYSWLYIVLALSVLVFGNDLIEDPQNDLTIKLVAPWSSTDFKLNLLESISVRNASNYLPTLLTLFNLNEDDSELQTKQPEQIFNQLITQLQVDKETKSLIEFDITYKVNSPRIQTHYEHYKHEVEDEFSKRLIKECKHDSFGKQILSDEKVKHDAWVLYNDKLYCSSDDLYALKTDSNSKVSILPFDRIIGDNDDAPLLILYADYRSDQFSGFFTNLYQSAQSGKLRFIWRYIPSQSTTEDEQLAGYGIDLTLKNSYLVDDDAQDISDSKVNSSSIKKLDIAEDFLKIKNQNDLKSISKKELEDLGAQLTSFIMNNQYTNYSKFELLNSILEDFPKFAHYLTKVPKDGNFDKVKEYMHNNELAGLTSASTDIYINGSPINKLELDVFKLVEKIESELQLIKDLKDFGLTVEQAKVLITRYAEISAVKQSQFRSGNSVMGNNENRFKVFSDSYKLKKRGGVVFFNDIEEDPNYRQYTTDRNEAYFGPEALTLQSNQIPPLRENIHDLIFVVNFGNKEQLRVFLTLTKLILDNGIPQQVGIIPILGDDPIDLKLAERFYFLVEKASPQEALALIYKYYEAGNGDEVEELLKLIEIPEDNKFDESILLKTLNKYSIETASIIFNGVIYELDSPNWQMAMGNQLSQDIALIRRHIEDGIPKGKSLKSLLYENAKSERDLRIIPKDPENVIYKSIDKELISNSTVFKKSGFSYDVSGTFWLIGDFNKLSVIKQLITLLEMLEESEYDFQIRIFNSGTPVKVIEEIKSKFILRSLTLSEIEAILEILIKVKSSSESPDIESRKFLESKKLPVYHTFMLFNGRYFRLDKNFSEKEINLLLEYEFSQRLEVFQDVVNRNTDHFKNKKLVEFNKFGNKLNNRDWFDLVSTLVTKSFHPDDKLYVTDVNRFDLSRLDPRNSFEISPYDPKKLVDIFLLIDPFDEFSQKAISIINSVKDFSFVNTRILLQPRVEAIDDVKIKRFYKGNYPSSKLQFDSKSIISQFSTNFTNIPGSTLLTTDLDIPSRWITTAKDSSIGVDLDNIKFDNYDNKSIYGTYELRNILVEGFARDVSNGRSPAGVAIELASKWSSDDYYTDTNIMSHLGYLQLQAKPGLWKFRIKDGKSSKHYSLLSSTENKFTSNNVSKSDEIISILNLKGLTVYPRLRKNPDYKDVSFLFDDDESVVEDNKSNQKPLELVNKWLGNNNSKKQADINVFSIASGHLYEKLISIMMTSVTKNTDKSVKFWIIENFVSSNFKQLLPELAQKYNFDYQFITYKWPNFLRKQREKHRTVWGYKMLFLDVLFPQDLKKVIFIDADQIARTDLQNLVDIDLQGAPYGFTPMCDSREEMEGYRFWKQGYWSQVLGDDLKYHISALYVVDLVQFRKLTAGDRLRSHYQKLSSDPGSLSNLDQDLPNNMQRQLKIFSLPQEWLWCETWCSDDTLGKAKMIDLCNNPITKENKLDTAKRLIPEWTEYNQEIEHLISIVEEKQRLQNTLNSKRNEKEKEKETEKENKNESDEDHDDEQWLHDEL
ncbi:UDPglucose glycoprotein glucose phosphotransferase [Scheffersomyces amazonensis]|uniref:UDPglucose glycoprotein glucose phosphotransferase n=1 Tax=Scheffersomyces amazonensis TaxID=1078765 RepID=UPI00315D5283